MDKTQRVKNRDMILPKIEITVTSIYEFWESWLLLVKASYGLMSLSQKELEIMLEALCSPYDKPLEGNAVSLLSKRLQIPRNKFLEFRKGLIRKGWVKKNFEFVDLIQSVRKGLKKQYDRYRTCNISMHFNLKYDPLSNPKLLKAYNRDPQIDFIRVEREDPPIEQILSCYLSRGKKRKRRVSENGAIDKNRVNPQYSKKIKKTNT